MANNAKIKNRISDDIIVKEFWRDNDRFADLFNTVLFGGKCVIRADELQELDTDVSGTIEIKEHRETLKRARDVVKKCYNGVEFNILGLEIQEKIHLAMPLRTMVYDTLGYIKEYNEIKEKNSKDNCKGNSREEFLSGLKYSDKLHPIITIVFYYGEKRWDGPVHISDMMVDMPENIRKMFNDYHINLVQVSDSQKYNFTNKDVKAMFDIMHSIYEKNFEYIAKNYADNYLSIDFIGMIGKMTGTKELIKIVNNERERKVVNVEMWSAMKEFLEGGKQEQIIEIIIKKVKKGKELSIIASEIEEEEQDVKPLYDAVVAEAPDYNMDKIKSRLK